MAKVKNSKNKIPTGAFVVATKWSPLQRWRQQSVLSRVAIVCAGLLVAGVLVSGFVLLQRSSSSKQPQRIDYQTYTKQQLPALKEKQPADDEPVPRIESYYSTLIEFQTGSGDTKAAQESYQRFLLLTEGKQQTNVDLHFMAAQIYLKTGNKQAAVAALDRAQAITDRVTDEGARADSLAIIEEIRKEATR